MMAKGDIPLSPKHGVNPSLLTCAICGESVGVALIGRLSNDEQAPRHVLDLRPCDKCWTEIEERSKMGIMFIVFGNPEVPDPQNRITDQDSFWPYFHSYHVITFEAGQRLQDAMPNFELKPINFMSFEIAVKLGILKPDGTNRLSPEAKDEVS